MFRLLLAAVVIAGAPLVQAQVSVEESTPLQRSTEASSDSGSNLQAELFYQLQALQREVQELRGLVEEQSHEIRRLKQQRMDDYLDLDRRVSRLTGESDGGSDSGPTSSGDSNGASEVSDAVSPETASETEVYRSAYQLLRDRKVDEAIAAFNGYLEEYPRGNYAGNSYYWLGEIYLLKDDLEGARDWFSRLLEEFPDDRKVSDAKFKLGKVHHQLGNDSRARELLDDVVADGSDASRMARRYLEENFQ